MNQVCASTVWKYRGAPQETSERRRSEERFRNHRDRFRLLWYRHHAAVAEQREPIRKDTDVIQAVASEVAVVDEKDVHAGGKERKQ